METQVNNNDDLDKDALLTKLVALNSKIDDLTGYGLENARKLVKLCDEFESHLDDIYKLNEQNIQTVAYGYGEDVRRDCEWSTQTPTKKEPVRWLSDRYDRGKRHLKQEVDVFIAQIEDNKKATE